MRGKPTADGQSITTEWKGQTLTLPVSPWGKPGAERPAAHGLIFKARANDVQVKSIPDGEQVTGVIHAGGAIDTGMATLAPGQSTTWHVRLGLFDPRSFIE